MVKHTSYNNMAGLDPKEKKVLRNRLYRKTQVKRRQDIPRLERKNVRLHRSLESLCQQLNVSMFTNEKVERMFCEANKKRAEEKELLDQLNDVTNTTLHGSDPTCVKNRRVLRNQVYRRTKRAEILEAEAIRAHNQWLKQTIRQLKSQYYPNSESSLTSSSDDESRDSSNGLSCVDEITNDSPTTASSSCHTSSCSEEIDAAWCRSDIFYDDDLYSMTPFGLLCAVTLAPSRDCSAVNSSFLNGSSIEPAEFLRCYISMFGIATWVAILVNYFLTQEVRIPHHSQSLELFAA
jgi:hypothetical protein